MKRYSTIVILLFIGFLIIINGCDKRNPINNQYNRISEITAAPDTIYSDNNLTISEIKVKVRDEKDFPVTDLPVKFKSNIGRMLYEVPTDSSGIATSTFWDDGALGEAKIEAFIDGDSASVMVTIAAKPQVQSLVLSVNSTNLNIDEIKDIKATVENTTGDVPDGTLVRFQTDKGFFIDSSDNYLGEDISAGTSNGYANIRFNAGTQRGVAIITATIDTLSATKELTIHPGSPTFMYLVPSSSEIEVNESVDVTASLEDKYHNPLESGQAVAFSTDIGTVLPANSSTDSLGIAITTFSAGVQGGLATITAVADSAQASTTINIKSSDVHYIQFNQQQQINLQVQGTGGQESIELSVSLYDLSGNLINYSTDVWFKLLNAPTGTNINNSESDSTSVEAINGQAVVSINSGTESGIVRIKAYVLRDTLDEISATKSNIVVNSGPPARVFFNIPGFDSGLNMGDGQWKVQVSALIVDAYNNPVSDGTAVFFYLDDDPDYASIEASAFIGNENADGDSLAGTAFTNLIYHGAHTNDVINVSLDVGNEVVFNGQLTLPLQQPWLDATALPSHIDWNESNTNNPPDNQIIDIRVILKDGQNNLINGQTLTFTSDLGNFQDAGSDSDNDIYTEVTGPFTFPIGQVDKPIMFSRYMCPPPGPGGPGTASGTIHVILLGYDVTKDVVVQLFRYESFRDKK